MKIINYAICILICSSLNSNLLFSQRPITQIEGFVEVYDNEDSSSLYLGLGSGQSAVSVEAPLYLYGTFLGSHAGQNNSSGFFNSFLGYQSGKENTDAGNNSFFGALSGVQNNGSNNSYMGYSSGKNNINGSENSFFGAFSGTANTGSKNSFIGYNSGAANTSRDNTFMGYNSGNKNTAGTSNSFFGSGAGETNTIGQSNTFIGYISGEYNTIGSNNTYVGNEAGNNSTSGSFNSFFGQLSGYQNESGNYNSYYGVNSGTILSNGVGNTLIGYEAGSNIEQGDSNIVIGHQAGPVLFRSSIYKKLFIDIEETDFPLIYGEFDNDLIRINGDLDVRGTLDISPSFDSTSIYLTNNIPDSLNESFTLNNIGIGAETLQDITLGGSNVVMGRASGKSLNLGSGNTLIGNRAGQQTKESFNTMLGYLSGKNVDGEGNVFLGNRSGEQSNLTLVSNQLHISNGPDPLIYGEFDNEIVRVNGELQIESNKLNIRNIGGSDSGSGIIWSEDANPAFGLVYDGNGMGGNNRLHLREFFGTTDTDLFTIKGDGKIGIGVTDPTQNLDVQGNIRIRTVGTLASSNDIRIDALGNLTTSMSDIRLKENIVVIPDALDKVSKLRGISFTWKSNPEAGVQNGIIAQDVLKVAPELIFEKDGYLGVDYSEMMGLLVEAIKEMKVENENLKSRMYKIENP